MKKKIQDVIQQEFKGLWGTDFSDDGIPVIKTNNMTYEGRIDFSDICKRNIGFDEASPNFLQKGDLIIEKSGGTKTHSVGYVNIFEGEDNKYICNNFILPLRPNKELVDCKYLFWQLHGMYEAGKFADCYNKTTGIQNLQKKTYFSKQINVPSKVEQQKIAAELDTIQSAIDNKKQQLSLLDEAVKSEFVEMFGNPVNNDKSFPKKRMTEVCPIQESKIQLDSDSVWLLNLDMIEQNTGTILEKQIVSMDALGNSTIQFSSEHVLYSKLRPYLNKVALPDEAGYATSELVPFLPKKEINKIYFAYLLRSENFVDLINSKSGGTKMPRASMDFIRKFEIPVPPIDLQEKFADFVQQIDKSKFVLQQQIQKLQKLLLVMVKKFLMIKELNYTIQRISLSHLWLQNKEYLP